MAGQRRSAALARRLWYAAAIGGFVLLAAFAIHTNPSTGLPLLIVVPVVGVLAVLYDRSLRRGTPLFALPRRRAPAAPRSPGEGEPPRR